MKRRTKPRVLVLADEALFASLFDERGRRRLDVVAEWARFDGADDELRVSSDERGAPGFGRRRPAVRVSSEDALRREVAERDALVTTWRSPRLTADLVRSAPRLRLIAHCGGEVRARMEDDVLDLVTVTNAAEPMARPVAEMAVALVLALVRRVTAYDREMRAVAVPFGDDFRGGETLAGRTVGVVGLGRVGRETARLLRAFDVRLLGHDPYAGVPPEDVETVALDDLCRRSSVVVLAAGLTAETKGLFDAERLALLADGAILVNVARGGLVDLDALLTELRRGRVAAALDVTDPLEPLPADHEFRRLPNVVLTPHVAGGGVETRRAIAETVLDDVERFFRGERPRNVVTRAMLHRMT
jgi:phosphoglycerate dehydrogenase-like enzyme